MSEEAPLHIEGKGIQKEKEEKIQLGEVIQLNHTLTGGGGIVDEPFNPRPNANIRDVLIDAQHIANQTDKRVFFKFNGEVASVDKYMEEQLVDKEEELKGIQKIIAETSKELRDAGHRAMKPEAFKAWQRELRGQKREGSRNSLISKLKKLF